ncbi:hypothetical protein KKB99_04355 [bacterium]|nr:hypothetical protein [bacterium]MBU1025226.1 hypothetical protein [bacterium]
MKIYSSYFGNRILNHVAKDMRQLVDDGFTGVVHTFSENDLRFYRDSFIDIVKISRDAGLDVDLDPWGVGGVFGGEAFSAWIAENPDEMQISVNGTPKSLACLNSKKFREFISEWADAAHKTGADGLFWDEPHLYIPKKNDPDTSWTCACKTCKSLFSDKYGFDFPETRTDDVVQFHAWTLIDFLTDMLTLGKKAGFRNTVCLLPKEFAQNDPLEWSEIASLENVDVISTDPYWFIGSRDVNQFVKSYSGKIKELADKNGIDAQIWIQGFRVPSGKENEIATAIEIAVNEGINNLAIWGFNACSHMSYLKCDNPELVWETAVESFRNCKNQSE